MQPIHLLVVDDDPASLYLIQHAFRRHKGEDIVWNLSTATDGEEALHLLFDEENQHSPLPDLILLDWNLPKVSGNEVLQRLKVHPMLRRIPVLIFSNSDARRDIHAAYDDHANGYIIKPSSMGPMAGIIATITKFWFATAQLPRAVRQ